MTQELNRQLRELERDAREAGERFLETYGEDVELYRREISHGIVAAGERLRADVAEITADNPLCTTITAQLCDYVEWLQWSLWDLPYYAVPIGADPAIFRERVAGCGYVYLAGRVIDDALDRHFTYKSKHATLFSAAIDQSPTAQEADSLAFLSGLLLCAEGLSRLAQSGDAEMIVVLRKVLQSFRRAVIGAMMERTHREDWTEEFYERLVFLKNVDFWRCLYSAVDPERKSPLYPFLERYYALAQKFNDVVDFPEDAKRGQPNLVSLHLKPGAENGNGTGPAGHVPASVESHLAAALLDLGERTATMPELERSVALLKLGESLRRAFEIGLFALDEERSASRSAGFHEDARSATLQEDARSAGFQEDARSAGFQPAAPLASSRPVLPSAGRQDASVAAGRMPALRDRDGAPAEPPPLVWHSTLEDVVSYWGSAALEDASCEVCGSRERKHMMEFRGFSYHTCLGCTHVYVAPRVRLDLLLDLASRLEHDDDENDFLEIQKIFAEPICHLIRLRAPGNRLLDLGFGRGHIMRVARAYSFEVYGMDSSSRLVGQLEPEFGKRLSHGTLGTDAIPWESFDAIVMSHVVEHLTDPGRVLRDVLAKLSPGGILYVAVPDIDSLQFRIFGKYWDAINPMVHMQYFNEESLSRLLRDSGFGNLERIRFPPLPRAIKPKWMQLFRELGGDESGECVIVAQRSTGEEAAVTAAP